MSLRSWMALPGLLVSTNAPLLAQTVRQEFTLRPGWNAIHLQVEPVDDAAAAVFGGLQVEEVWSHLADAAPVDFLVEPSEAPVDDPAWRRFVPGDAARTSLFSLEVDHVYLVHSTAGGDVSFEVEGRPTCLVRPWIPDAVNLRGFPVDPDVPPSFDEFFADSPAHQGEVLDLRADGEWVPLDRASSIESGRAYMVACEGPSDFLAPLEVVPEGGDGLDYGPVDLRRTLVLRHRGSEPGLVELESSVPGGALTRITTDAEGRTRLHDLAPRSAALLEPGVQSLGLGLRRGRLADGPFGAVVTMRDGRGTRWRFPVEARNDGSLAGLWVAQVSVEEVGELQAGVFDARTTTSGGTAAATAGGLIRFLGADNDLEFAARAPGREFDGLRVVLREDPGLSDGGAVVEYDAAKPRELTIRILRKKTTAAAVIDACNREPGLRDEYVCRPANGEGAGGLIEQELSPVGRPLELRLIVHVDGDGQVRLLKEAYQLVWPGSTVADPLTGQTTVEPEDPARIVLVTERAQLGGFEGVALRNGSPVGRRVSSVGVDFAADRLDAKAGSGFAPGASFEFLVELDPGLPTHPYRHDNHPDHGRVVERPSTGEEAEVPPPISIPLIQRTLSFTLDGGGNATAVGLEAGVDLLTGRYVETIEGLLAQPLHAAGTVRLTRVSRTATLER